MSINKLYGMSDGIINLVKNEMGKTEFISESGIFDKAVLFFPSEDFNIIDICDLIHQFKS